MPVTTPTANVRPKILVQNRAASAYLASPERMARHFQSTMSGASPIVSCGKR